jgi:hypothetical protein
LTKKFCQYCFREFNNKRQRTGEHIIPQGIIKLFPEQNISYFKGKEFIDNKGRTIADVCSCCNNDLLSKVDDYGKELIQDQYLEIIPVEQVEDSFEKKIDYFLLTRWLMKIIYNDRRSMDLNCTWFKKARGYMLEGTLVENLKFSIFAGVYINTTPITEEAHGYMPMQIVEEPQLFVNSLGAVRYGLDPREKPIDISMKTHTYCIRFGTAVFYCIFWNENIDDDDRMSYNSFFENVFEFKQITSNQKEYSLKCISAHSNSSIGYNHLLTAAAQLEDRYIIESLLNGRTVGEAQEDFINARTPKDVKKSKVLVEAATFPNNKNIMSEFKRIFGDG